MIDLCFISKWLWCLVEDDHLWYHHVDDHLGDQQRELSPHRLRSWIRLDLVRCRNCMSSLPSSTKSGLHALGNAPPSVPWQIGPQKASLSSRPILLPPLGVGDLSIELCHVELLEVHKTHSGSLLLNLNGSLVHTRGVRWSLRRHAMCCNRLGCSHNPLKIN